MTPSKKTIKVLVAADSFDVVVNDLNVRISLVEPDLSSQPTKIAAEVRSGDSIYTHGDIGFGELADALIGVIKKRIKADKKANKGK